MFKKLNTLTLLVFFGILIYVPSLFTGFNWDDFFYYSRMEQLQGQNKIIDFTSYHVFSGIPEEMKVLKTEGYMPWFTEDNLHVKMFRYLPAILFSVDYNLFKKNIELYHLHSLLWWALILIFLYKTVAFLTDKKMAFVALVLFICSDINSMSVSWLSGRHLLVSLALGIISFYFYITGRQQHSRKRIIACYTILLLGLFTSESILGIFSYFLMYELFLNKDALKKRFLYVLGLITLGLSYLVMYKILGYGVSNSYFYLNPFKNPIRFLTNAPQFLITNSGGLISGAPIDQWFFAPSSQLWLILSGLISTAAFIFILSRLYKTVSAETKKILLFAGVGCLLAMAPILASLPNRRTLVYANVGFCILVTSLFIHFFKRVSGSNKKNEIFSGVMFFLIIGVHVLYLGFNTFQTQIDLYHASLSMKKLVQSPDLAIANPETKNVVVLLAPNPTIEYVPIAYQFYNQTNFKSWHFLSLSPLQHQFTKVSDTKLSMKILDGEMLTSASEIMYRGPDQPYHVKDRIDLGIATAEVMQMGPHQAPTQIDFDFTKPLDSEDFLFVTTPSESFRTNQGLMRYYTMTETAIFKKVNFFETTTH